MYQCLGEASAGNSIIITASRRLARVLKSEYARDQLALGRKAWRSPDVRFIDDWLVSLIDDAPEAQPLVLGANASGVLWERALGHSARDPLLNTGALLRQARQSWKRLHDWRVPLREVSAAAASRDERLFAAAARGYRETLKTNRWIDVAELSGCITGLFESGVISVPASIVHAGFDRFVPAIDHLFSVLRDRGCEIAAAPAKQESGDVAVVAFENVEAELRAAGAWARDELAKDPDLTIGIVSSSLDSDAAATERLVREGLAPGWQYGGSDLRTAVNTSYGRRLSDYPAIAVALLLLKWPQQGLSFREISVLLRSQFIAGEETAGRCRLEMYLRRHPERAWSPSDIIGLMQRRATGIDAGKWLECVAHLSAFGKGSGDIAPPSEWADRFDGLLGKLGWPGTATLSSEEFQLRNRWRELLNDLARLEIVCPGMRLAEAGWRLTALANDAIFQPEAGAGIVQLLGPLEAAGMRFDRIWISGLDADHWPPAAHPLTLVSRQLQRRYAMPDSTPEDTLAYSRRVLRRLLNSARRVRLSWPRSSEESEASASPLIAGFPAATDGTADPGWHAGEFVCSRGVSQASTDLAPPVTKGELVAGGAVTVQRQLTEPFSAFAFGRLRATELEMVMTGLSPAQRGRLIHKSLHLLFRDRPTQDEIRNRDQSDFRARVLHAIDASLKEYARHADPVLRRMLALERDRLRRLVEAFVAAELTREPFAIEAVERELEFEHSGVGLTLRIDRIDRLADRSLLIADYKTGRTRNLLDRHGNPSELQLVLYACALEERTGGLLLINLDSRSIRYSGASASGEWDGKRADQWDRRMATWQAMVRNAMQGIAKGDARINLALPTDKSRPLNILSRFQERLRAER